MKNTFVELWFDDAAFHAGRTVLLLALLRGYEDGRAEISIEEKQYHFASVEEAQTWLAEDEFLCLSNQEYGLSVKIPRI